MGLVKDPMEKRKGEFGWLQLSGLLGGAVGAVA